MDLFICERVPNGIKLLVFDRDINCICLFAYQNQSDTSSQGSDAGYFIYSSSWFMLDRVTKYAVSSSSALRKRIWSVCQPLYFNVETDSSEREPTDAGQTASLGGRFLIRPRSPNGFITSVVAKER